MITFDQIKKANEGLSTINMKDKPYVMVPQRVQAFRKLFPEGFIITDILSNENGVCLMKTQVGYYDGDRKIILGTGMAYERETNGYVNKTSFIENCETSSVGRALGFLALGIDGGGICSAEELVNAVNNQKNDNVRILPVRNTASEQPAAEMNLDAIRAKLDVAIKAIAKNMTREQKLQFLNETVIPTIGQRNWRLCEDPKLLMALLTAIERKAA